MRAGAQAHGKSVEPGQPRKACYEGAALPVPQTDTGRLAEEAKVDE